MCQTEALATASVYLFTASVKSAAQFWVHCRCQRRADINPRVILQWMPGGWQKLYISFSPCKSNLPGQSVVPAISSSNFHTSGMTSSSWGTKSRQLILREEQGLDWLTGSVHSVINAHSSSATGSMSTSYGRWLWVSGSLLDKASDPDIRLEGKRRHWHR